MAYETTSAVSDVSRTQLGLRVSRGMQLSAARDKNS